jgi:hypothetical protein
MIKSIEIILQDPNQSTVYEGEDVRLEAKPSVDAKGGGSQLASAAEIASYKYAWDVSRGGEDGFHAEVLQDPLEPWVAVVKTSGAVLGKYAAEVEVSDGKTTVPGELEVAFEILPAPLKPPIEVHTGRSVVAETPDVSFWQGLRTATAQISFNAYSDFIDGVMVGKISIADKTKTGRGTPFPGIDAYQLLKTATEVFLTTNTSLLIDYKFDDAAAAAYNARHGRNQTAANLKTLWTQQYLIHRNTTTPAFDTLPYFDLIRRRLGDPIISTDRSGLQSFDGILQEQLTRPCFLELIWSYWHEEAMLVQTLNAIALRFQNQRAGTRDPLATFDLAPLRPLSNLLWGYIQDEQHRLTVARRAYEYDHHYGITLHGKAVPELNAADSRSKFLEAFHTLLTVCITFYKQDDNTMVIADPFPVLNALKEVHLLLTEGQHNQFGDLPFTARIEMLMQQWILSRSEMREFLGGRPMVPYPEAWMDRVDAMKKLQNWTDVSVIHFGELARFGEQLLLSIRYGNWSDLHDSTFAANWARDFRAEVKQYIHAYRAATGVDLAPETAAPPIADRDLQPSVHLRRRLEVQRAQRPAGNGVTRVSRQVASRVGSDGAEPFPATRRGQSIAPTRGEMEYSEEF